MRGREREREEKREVCSNMTKGCLQLKKKGGVIRLTSKRCIYATSMKVKSGIENEERRKNEANE